MTFLTTPFAAGDTGSPAASVWQLRLTGSPPVLPPFAGARRPGHPRGALSETWLPVECAWWCFGPAQSPKLPYCSPVYPCRLKAPERLLEGERVGDRVRGHALRTGLPVDAGSPPA